jgi:hypothetical protein
MTAGAKVENFDEELCEEIYDMPEPTYAFRFNGENSVIRHYPVTKAQFDFWMENSAAIAHLVEMNDRPSQYIIEDLEEQEEEKDEEEDKVNPVIFEVLNDPSDPRHYPFGSELNIEMESSPTVKHCCFFFDGCFEKDEEKDEEEVESDEEEKETTCHECGDLLFKGAMGDSVVLKDYFFADGGDVLCCDHLNLFRVAE